MAALLLAGCAGPGPGSRLAGAEADRLAGGILEEGDRSLPAAARFPRDDLERILNRFVEGPSTLRRERLLRIGPGLFLAEYRFEGLRLRHPVTGMAYAHDGSLEMELRLEGREAVLRHARVRSDSLPPRWEEL